MKTVCYWDLKSLTISKCCVGPGDGAFFFYWDWLNIKGRVCIFFNTTRRLYNLK